MLNSEPQLYMYIIYSYTLILQKLCKWYTFILHLCYTIRVIDSFVLFS